MTKWKAVCVREDDLWVVHVNNPHRSVTQARRLEQVPERVAEVLKLMEGVTVDPGDVEIETHVNDDVDKLVVYARDKRIEEADARAQADQLTSFAVRRLHRSGLPYRDIGAMLGISHQRAQQIGSSPLRGVIISGMAADAVADVDSTPDLVDS